jgi:dTDP-4-dehydrorhamnose 3,5-epimerase-like enzyme
MNSNSPSSISGKSFIDERGKLFFNNDFNATEVKRIYIVENNKLDFVRGWQGHKIEQRWFSCMVGSFSIWVQPITNFEKDDQQREILEFNLNSNQLDVLHIPSGYVTAIKSLEENSKLLAMSDYNAGEIQDEIRFPYK